MEHPLRQRHRYPRTVGSLPKESLEKLIVKWGIGLIGVAALAIAGYLGSNIVGSAANSLSQKIEQRDVDNWSDGKNGAIPGATAISGQATQTADALLSRPPGTPTPKR